VWIASSLTLLAMTPWRRHLCLTMHRSDIFLLAKSSGRAEH
jgi:hypothetical protein